MARPAWLTVIGDLVEDVVVHVRPPVLHGTDNPARIERRRGGSAANVAIAAAATGRSTRFLGRVGDDALGTRLVDDLARSGVDVRVQRGGTTGCIVVHVDDRGERTMFPDRGTSAQLEQIDPSWLDGSALLHLTLYSFLDATAAGHLLQAARTSRAGGAVVSIDLSATSAIEALGEVALGELLVDLAPALVFANEAEAERAGRGAIPSGATLIVKAGPRPTTIVHPGGRTEIVPAPNLGAVNDTTGAGDAFAGTFVARWSSGASLVDACDAAHAAAARLISQQR